MDIRDLISLLLAPRRGIERYGTKGLEEFYGPGMGDLSVLLGSPEYMASTVIPRGFQRKALDLQEKYPGAGWGDSSDLMKAWLLTREVDRVLRDIEKYRMMGD